MYMNTIFVCDLDDVYLYMCVDEIVLFVKSFSLYPTGPPMSFIMRVYTPGHRPHLSNTA